MKYALASLLLLASVAFVAADCRRVGHAAHHRVDAVLIGDYRHDYPYRVGYADSDLIREMFQAYKEKAEAHEKVLKAMASGTLPPSLKAALAPPNPGLAALVTNCASCHAQDVAKAKGGGNVFFKDGAFVDEGDNMTRVVAALKTGKMGSRDLPKIDDSAKLAAMFYLVELPPPTPELKK